MKTKKNMVSTGRATWDQSGINDYGVEPISRNPYSYAGAILWGVIFGAVTMFTVHQMSLAVGNPALCTVLLPVLVIAHVLMLRNG